MIGELVLVEFIIIDRSSKWCGRIFVNIPILKVLLNSSIIFSFLFKHGSVLVCVLGALIIPSDDVNGRTISGLGISEANFGRLFPNNLSELIGTNDSDDELLVL